MAQSNDLTLAPAITGLEQRTEINSILEAIGSNHKDSTRPSYATAGMLWLDDSADPVWTLYFYDGTDDIAVGTFNVSANTFVPSGTSIISFFNDNSVKTATHTLDASHAGQGIFCDATSGSVTSNITAAATLGLGWYAVITKTDATTNTVTIDGNGSELLNGDTTLVLRRQNDTAFVHCTGTAFKAVVISNEGILKVSSDDTTPDYLENKLVEGNGINLATVSPGGNETRQISVDIAANKGLEFSGAAVQCKAGTAITLNSSGINVNVGPGANQVVQRDASGNYPAGNGSALTNLNVTNQIGVNQTWQNPSRSIGVSYQNTTGKPIMVSFSSIGNIGSNSSTTDYHGIEVSTNNSTWVVVARMGTGNIDNIAGNCNAIIPAGHYYRYTRSFNNGGTLTFAELR